MRPWPGTHLDLDIAGAGEVAQALTGSDTAARRTSTAFRKRAQDDSQRPRRRRSGRKGRDVITCGLGGARVVLRDLENHSFQTLAPPHPRPGCRGLQGNNAGPLIGGRRPPHRLPRPFPASAAPPSPPPPLPLRSWACSLQPICTNRAGPGLRLRNEEIKGTIGACPTEGESIL